MLFTTLHSSAADIQEQLACIRASGMYNVIGTVAHAKQLVLLDSITKDHKKAVTIVHVQQKELVDLCKDNLCVRF